MERLGADWAVSVTAVVCGALTGSLSLPLTGGLIGRKIPLWVLSRGREIASVDRPAYRYAATLDSPWNEQGMRPWGYRLRCLWPGGHSGSVTDELGTGRAAKVGGKTLVGRRHLAVADEVSHL